MVLAADLGELVFGQVADGGAVEVDVAGGGRVEAGEQAEQRGLAAAGGAHDGDELALGDGEVEAFEDVDGAGAVADGFAQVCRRRSWVIAVPGVIRCRRIGQGARYFLCGRRATAGIADRLIRWNDEESSCLCDFSGF